MALLVDLRQVPPIVDRKLTCNCTFHSHLRELLATAILVAWVSRKVAIDFLTHVTLPSSLDLGFCYVLFMCHIIQSESQATLEDARFMLDKVYE